MKTLPNQPIRKFLAACGLFAAISSAQAQFTFPVYERFSEYPEGERISKNQFATDGVTPLSPNSYIYWGNGVPGNSGSATASPVVTNTSGLVYPGLQPDPASPNLGVTSQTGVGRTATAPFTSQSAGTIYTSFLINLQTLPSGNRAIYGLNANSTGTPNPGSGPSIWVSPTGQLLLGKGNASAPSASATSPLAIGGTYLVVMAYTFVSGNNNDQVDLWVSPTKLGNNASIPTPTLSTTNFGTSADAAALSSVNLYAPSSTPIMTYLIDEIRVDNNWAGVTPSSCSPGNVYNVLGGGTGCPGDSFLVGLSGSDSGVTYLLYTNGVFSGQTAAGNGNSIGFGLQSVTAVYGVLASNVTSSCVAWMNNTASITVLAGPQITSAPVPLAVATNGTGGFQVTATGLGLSYHWYKDSQPLNDVGHISGSTTPTLTISPATTADAATTLAGYYVVISNTCGLTATSSPVALTLQAAANLTWVGNNPNSNWDVATTANFNNGSGAAVFNPGDKVIFDDSSPVTNINLVGNFLTPSQILINSGGNFLTFGGSGNISGPGSLVMNAGTTVIFSNANTYSGGSALNNGTVSIRNSAFGALGTGTITMNGGTLDLFASGSATAGISNNVVTTGDSRLQYDGTGSFGAVVFGTVTGNSGTTLTINTDQIPATPSRVRFYNTNFTDNANIYINTSSTQLAPYNSSGTQTYNGTISGGGGIITRQGGGTAIFNGANTYTAGTTLSTGITGLGRDTVTSNPPFVDSGPLGTGPITLALDGAGTAGNSTVISSGGAHTVANTIGYVTGTNNFTFILAGTNALNLSGAYNLVGSDGTVTNRVIQVDNTNAVSTLSGVISDNGQAGGIIKTGAGTLALSAVDTYTGPTTVSNGTLLVNGQIDAGAVTVAGGALGGSGTILGPVTVATGAALVPGNNSTGTLAINNALVLSAGSTTQVEVNKSTTAHDLVTATSVTYAGTLVATNLAGSFSGGETYTIFTTSSHTGNFTNIVGTPGIGKTWSFNPTNGVLSVVGSNVATNRINVVFATTNGNSVNLQWPADHLGWRLEAQTNNPGTGLTSNWVTVAGSTNVTQITTPINTTQGSVFFRLVYP